ncbi:MAG: hypothetical protein JNM17_05300 [Archangium sp.]|nr:hypothetical protein [Archangium sp.]
MKSLFFASLIMLASCTTPTTVASPAPVRGKPTAPVSVNAELSGRSAQLTVTFDGDATDVRITAGGVDGLVVEGEPVIVSAGTFAKGASHRFQVNFTPGPNKSALVVSVAGSFNGASRARVASFTLGQGGTLQSPGTVMTTDDGETVKVLPAATP